MTALSRRTWLKLVGGVAAFAATARYGDRDAAFARVLERVPHRVHAGVGRVQGDEDELVAERSQLAEQEGARIAAPLEGGRVVEGEGKLGVGLLHRAGKRPHLLIGNQGHRRH